MTDWHKRIRGRVREVMSNQFRPGARIDDINNMVIVKNLRDFPPRLPLKKESLNDLFLFQKNR